MSWQIQIQSAKPNPLGKDRPRYGAIPAEQLLAEWVDLKNVGDAAVDLSVVNLANLQFDAQCRQTGGPSIYWTGPSSAVLGVGQVIRVHTGKSAESVLMNSADRTGVDFHAFAEKGNFVLNNKCGDTLSVWWQSQNKEWHLEDSASYDPHPAEGAILRRVGQKLVPAGVFAR